MSEPLTPEPGALPESPDPNGVAGETGAAGRASDNGQPLAMGLSAAPGATAAGTGQAESHAEGHPEGHQPVHTARTLIVALAVGCFALFWWAGGWVDFPRHRDFEASLFQQTGAGTVLAFVAAALLFVACVVGAHLIAGRWWLYAGPFVAAAGLAAWSIRGGPSRYVYLHAAESGAARSVFLALAAEAALLSTFVGAVWWVFTAAAREGYARANPNAPVLPTPPTGNRLQALGVQVLLTAAGVCLFAPVDDKKEVLAAVFFACFAGASLTEYFFGKDELEGWYWLGPAVVAVLGYVLGYATNAAHSPLVTGQLSGWFAPLARPLPLDYASAGMIGALLGFWTGEENPEFAAGVLKLQPQFVMAAVSRRSRG